MFDAFRRLSSIVKATTQFIVNFRVLMLYLTSSILLAVSCIMTTFSEFSTGATTRKTTFYEIYILFLAILMLVMLYILNGLADKIYMEE
jgi:hypothetical protein